MKGIDKIRNDFAARMYKCSTFYISDFRHPVSRKHYSVSYDKGYITVVRRAKNREVRKFTCDSFLYFWLEDDTTPTQCFEAVGSDQGGEGRPESNGGEGLSLEVEDRYGSKNRRHLILL